MTAEPRMPERHSSPPTGLDPAREALAQAERDSCPIDTTLVPEDRAREIARHYDTVDARATVVAIVAHDRRSASCETPSRTAPRSRGAGRPSRRSTRSSARSGDSGSDDGESEPAAPRRCIAPGCGRDISHRRADAQTCGDTCYKRASRADRQHHDDEPTAEQWLRAAIASDILGRCHCPRDLVAFAVDQDGDATCIWCGHLIGRVASRLVDFDLFSRLVRGNGVSVSHRHDEQASRSAREQTAPGKWRTKRLPELAAA